MRRTAVLFVLPLLLTGCAASHDSTQKVRDLEFTVVEREDEPEKLQDMIRENREEPFQIFYADQGVLYIAEGYGSQPTTGYSVEVRELYETEDAVRIRTNLLGPEKGEETKEITTYPYVAVQLEYIEKDVLFD